MIEKNKKTNAEIAANFADNAWSFAFYLFSLFRELWLGFRENRLPYAVCSIPGTAFALLLFFDYDKQLLRLLFIPNLVIASQLFFLFVFSFTFTAGFFIWAHVQWARAKYLNEEIGRVFRGIKLKNGWKETPKFISDRPVDHVNRHLKLSKELLTESDFKSKTDDIAQGLQIYIEGINEVREDGTIDIFYSTVGMPKRFECQDYNDFSNFSFVVGKSRSLEINSSLMESPHILVAGESGGGKSSFLRHLLTTLYINNKTARFLFIDLKDNLEGQIFAGLDRMTVSDDPTQAIQKLTEVKGLMETRSAALKEAGAKDLDEYIKIRKERAQGKSSTLFLPHLPRYIIAVDEAANLYLVTKENRTSEVIAARDAISRISRMGRALGFHLIFGVQRPDTAAIESQVKANLTQILAFKAANNASSMTILDSIRAAQLPQIPGRAIWKSGGQIVEIQTPLLDKKRTQELLGIKPKEVHEEPQVLVGDWEVLPMDITEFKLTEERTNAEGE
jgi:S-DNA-T family DNA segregation ATPase FtsK/SpoIIIE